ncbi:hypothetical protein CISIN_1g0282851mg, partial [Citrus sinensis]
KAAITGEADGVA